jgi:hypothetical protein
MSLRANLRIACRSVEGQRAQKERVARSFRAHSAIDWIPWIVEQTHACDRRDPVRSRAATRIRMPTRMLPKEHHL